MWLRQSTASQEILLGPFLDSTDGNTAETALTIANTDIKLWVEGGTTEANKNIGGATHIAAGRYYTVLDATDTATLGKLEVNVHVAGALAVRRSFMVVPAMVYDALVLGTDNLDVSAVQFAGQTITCSGGVTIPAATLASTTNITAATGVVLSGVTHTGAVIPTVSTVTDGAKAANLVGTIAAGTHVAQSGDSFARIGAAGAGLTSLPWNAAWDATIADAVWDEVLADHLTAGTTGNALNAAGAAGDPWTTALPGAYGAGTAGKIIGDNINATISSRLAAAGYTAPDNASITTILADTNDIQTRLPAALVAGRIDASVGAMAANVVTASAVAADAVTEIQNGLATAAALAVVDGVVDAVLVDTAELQVAHTAGNLGANVDKINGVTITGNGSTTPFDVV